MDNRFIAAYFLFSSKEGEGGLVIKVQFVHCDKEVGPFRFPDVCVPGSFSFVCSQPANESALHFCSKEGERGSVIKV